MSSPTQPDPTQQLFRLMTGHVVASAVQVAAKLNVADRMADGPKSAAELASTLGAREDGLYRVLRALSALGVFAEVAPRRFALTPVGELLRRDVPGSVHGLALWISSPFHFRVYADLLHTVRTGQPAAEHVVKMPVFDYLVQDEELSAIFNNAMTLFSEMVVPAVLDAYDFSGIGTLVDIGGGHGALLTGILAKYPQMRGVIFDVEPVTAGTRERVAAAGLSDRCEVLGGDFFKAVPAGDAYIMKHIIHDWDDDRAGLILHNIREATADGADGRVILVEGIIDDSPEAALEKVMDLEMLVMPGGRERTVDEFRALFASAGFELTNVMRTQSPALVIEAKPAK
jgi:hypothetical protein